ncbi:MAG: hypothetical protein R6V10_04180 [bacterium]
MEEKAKALSGTAASRRRGPALPAVATAVVAALLYLAFISRSYNFDGVVFSLWLGQAVHAGNTGNLFHPHHMLYLPAAYAFARLLGFIGAEAGMAATLQLMDVILAAGTILLFHLLCFRHTRGRFVSTLASLLLAFSWSFWYLSIEPEVYILHTLVVLFSISVLFFFTYSRLRGKAPGGSWLLQSMVLGVCGALCLLTHITGGLFLLPLALGSFLYLRAAPGAGIYQHLRAGVAPALLTLTCALLIISAVYWIGYEITARAQEQGFVSWLIGLASPDTGLGYKKSYWEFSPAMFQMWLSGMEKNIVAGGRHSFAVGKWLYPVRAVVLLLYISGIMMYVLRFPRLLERDKRVHVLLLTAVIPLSLFTMIWEPANFELKTALHPLIWLAVGMGVQSFASSIKTNKKRILVYALLPVLAVLLFFHNFYSSILPSSKEENNLALQRAYHIRDHTEPGAVIYMGGVSGGYRMGKIYVLYFAGRETRVADWIMGRGRRPFPENLLNSLYRERHRPVYVLEELLKEGPALSELGKNHDIEPARIKNLFLSMKPQLSSRRSKDFALYRLHPEKIQTGAQSNSPP